MATSDLAVFSTIGVRVALEALAPQFEQARGCKLAITWGTAPMVVKRLEAGESADVLILNRAGVDAVRGMGKMVQDSDTTLASSGVAVAVKAGARKPDISTAAALKQTLLAAKAIAYTDPKAGGASGIHFAKVLERLGIAEQMKAKTKFPPAGGFSAELLISGEAELAVQQVPELLHVAGAEIVGPLPGDLDAVTEFAAVVGSDAKDAEGARALIAFLRTPEAQAVFRAKGLMTP
jgi:molybdate transport system substrate-binding protein